MIKVDECDPLGELEPSFPYRDVQIRRGEDIKEFYEMQAEIGRGKFGTVYRCREKTTGLQLAAKFVATPRRDDRRNVEREVEIMRRLQHPRLIQLYDAFDSSGKAVWLVLEIIEGGELFERVIDDDFVLTEKSCTIFMRQICEGVEFIHRQNILHLDMKPENILCLTKTGNRIKIIDFGLARKFDPQKKLQVLFGTPEFVAPEVVNFDQIGYGTDMWSVGVICYVLLSGLSPFMGETDVETMANVTIAKYDFDDEAFNEISEDAKDFIRKLLLKDKELRMSSSQCLSHPWLKRTPLTPSSPTPTPRIIQEELDVTKDNLRSFVERWNEHPDSPYVFDKACHSICPLPPPSSPFLLPLSSASHHSLHGMSPSPCGSLSSASSSPESVLEADTRLPPPQQSQPKDDPYYYNHYSIDGKGIEPPPPWYVDRLLQERRASDSTCVVTRKHAGELSRVNLVDEIRKLSDRLFQMASRHNAASENASKDLPRPLENEAGAKRASFEDVTLSGEEGDASRMRKSTFLAGPIRTDGTAEEESYRRPKFKITPFARDVPLTPCSKTETASTRNEQTSATSTSSSVDRSSSRVSVTHSLRWGLPISGQPTYSRTFSRTSSAASSCSSASSRESTTFPIGCPSSSSSSSCHSAPQSPTRTSRGVVSSPEVKADLTEDLIAHLLDGNGWDKRCESGRETKEEVVGGRKAMSMEWSRVDVTMESLGRRTMASLRQYFQEADATTDSATQKDNLLGRGDRQTLARNVSQLGV